ncbi:ribonucleotide-diphosphate reductase subunit beta [Candidatus Woesearchaeota archaeon]|nr:ribonucleotide-diphosphate reductase subunit beta [Candidatus Woesearchaeota archaeon]
MKRKKLFNPEGDDSVNNRQAIGGNTTNLFNLNNVKYTWTKDIYRMMMGNFWVPEKVDLNQDIVDYEELIPEEKDAFDAILSFLVFLDSIQTNNIPNISNYITAPEISTILAIQTYQEAIHSQSYAYIIESIIPADKREKIYDHWRENKILLERNKYIAKIYQDFIDDENDISFAKVLIANFILEGLYFYNGFNFFYNLASRNTLLGTADQIRYINRDELTHVVIFKHIISALKEEKPGLITQKLVHEMFDEAVKQEIEWANYIFQDKILGINKESTEQYTKYLANRRLKVLGFDELYEGYDENPYAHLERIADTGGDTVKSNFFESTNTGYSQSSTVDGWDDL